MIMNKERQQRFISMSKVSQKLLSHSVFSSIKKYLMSYPLVNWIYLKAIFSFYARLLISISSLTRKKNSFLLPANLFEDCAVLLLDYFTLYPN